MTISVAPSVPPTTPRPQPAIRTCPTCYGGGVIYVRECERHNFPHPVCDTCQGKGYVPVTDGDA